MAWLQFTRFSLTLTGAGTLPVSTKLVGPLSLLLIGRSLCSSAGLRFCKVPDQQPQPSSLLNGLGGPFPVRVVAVPAAARGTRAKAAMEPAAEFTRGEHAVSCALSHGPLSHETLPRVAAFYRRARGESPISRALT